MPRIKKNKIMALSGSKYQGAVLGQFGSIFTDGTGAVAVPTDYIICAITVLGAATFTELTVEDAYVRLR